MDNKLKNLMSWSFKNDSVHNWAYWNNFLSHEECKQIINLGNEKGLNLGKVVEDKNKTATNKIRESEISWLSPSDNIDWLYTRLTKSICELNDQYFKFDIYGLLEGLQFTKYQSPSGRYGKHLDKVHNYLIRKLSFSIQLSDSNSYQGGNLELYVKNEPIITPKNRGTLILFPSYILHEVTPVTEGTRYSLVSWVAGSNFK